jgi:lipoprotein-anchoring transpeptidase ErfK/SrfK
VGRHSRTARPRVRSAVTAGLVGLGTIASVGIGNAAGPAPVEGTPCTGAARACVDLVGRQAWLLEGGAVVRGPLPISPGGPGSATPAGDFRVEWKNKNHRSTEFDGAPMPFAVFFAEGGIAFHEGDLTTASAGCVRLAQADASAFYDFLAVGDRVQVR